MEKKPYYKLVSVLRYCRFCWARSKNPIKRKLARICTPASVQQGSDWPWQMELEVRGRMRVIKRRRRVSRTNKHHPHPLKLSHGFRYDPTPTRPSSVYRKVRHRKQTQYCL